MPEEDRKCHELDVEDLRREIEKGRLSGRALLPVIFSIAWNRST